MERISGLVVIESFEWALQVMEHESLEISDRTEFHGGGLVVEGGTAMMIARHFNPSSMSWRQSD